MMRFYGSDFGPSMQPRGEVSWAVRILVGRVEARYGPDPFASYFDESVADDARAAPRIPSSLSSGPECEGDDVVANFRVVAHTWEQAQEVAEEIRQSAISRALASVSEARAQGWTMSMEVARVEGDDSA
jgi:hypothetical protein